MNKFDEQIAEELERFNKALRTAQKPKIRKRYPVYPPKAVARKKAWR